MFLTTTATVKDFGSAAFNMLESPLAHASLERLSGGSKEARTAYQAMAKSHHKLVESSVASAKAQTALATALNAAPFCKGGDAAGTVCAAMLEVAAVQESIYACAPLCRLEQQGKALERSNVETRRLFQDAQSKYLAAQSRACSMAAKDDAERLRAADAEAEACRHSAEMRRLEHRQELECGMLAYRQESRAALSI